MRRRRSAQVLVASGLVLAVLCSLAATAFLLTRTTTVVSDAAPDLLQIPVVRAEVRAQFSAGIETAYQPVPVSEAVLDIATERMVDNGYVIDEFGVAFDSAHRAWLDGGALAVSLDPTVVTRAAQTGLSDADPVFAAANPLPELVTPAPIPIPWDGSADSAETAMRVFGVLALGGLVMFAAGAIIEPRAGRPLKALARGVVAWGALVIVVGLIPSGALVSLDDRLAAVAALVGPIRLPMLVVAAVVLFCGLWLHGAADRIVAGVVRTVDSARHHSAAASPVRSGGRQLGRQSTRRRAAAIDAFFDADQPAKDNATDEADQTVDADDPFGDEVPIVIDARGGGEDDGGVEESDDVDDGAPPDRPAPTPEQERAEALAAERREALERIDGTKGGYRTHLGR